MDSRETGQWDRQRERRRTGPLNVDRQAQQQPEDHISFDELNDEEDLEREQVSTFSSEFMFLVRKCQETEEPGLLPGFRALSPPQNASHSPFYRSVICKTA